MDRLIKLEQNIMANILVEQSQEEFKFEFIPVRKFYHLIK